MRILSRHRLAIAAVVGLASLISTQSLWSHAANSDGTHCRLIQKGDTCFLTSGGLLAVGDGAIHIKGDCGFYDDGGSQTRPCNGQYLGANASE